MKKPEHLEWLSKVDLVLKPVSSGSVMLVGSPCVRIDASQLGAALERIKDPEAALDLDLFEDAFIQDLGSHLELTCRFLSTRDQAKELIIKSEISLKGPKAPPTVESISRVWPMASSFELEMSALFGVHFAGRSDSGSDFSLWAPGEGSGEFPMRKFSGPASDRGASS